MLKHILTSKCNRKCGYCIARNVKHEQVLDFTRVSELYADYLSEGHTEIMLTGGEPSMAERFSLYVGLAQAFFSKVFITTQNPELIQNGLYRDDFDAITFSIHDAVVPEVTNGTTVYASVLDARYEPGLAEELKAKGYAGLTINENHRTTEVFTQELPEIENFSIRINRRGKCLDEPMIMPDLTTIENFNDYL